MSRHRVILIAALLLGVGGCTTDGAGAAIGDAIEARYSAGRMTTYAGDWLNRTPEAWEWINPLWPCPPSPDAVACVKYRDRVVPPALREDLPATRAWLVGRLSDYGIRWLNFTREAWENVNGTFHCALEPGQVACVPTGAAISARELHEFYGLARIDYPESEFDCRADVECDATGEVCVRRCHRRGVVEPD